MVKVALVGVGNNASSLVQGVMYYRHLEVTATRQGLNSDAWIVDSPGLMTDYIGGLSPADIEFVAAYDVDATKVGNDLSVAIFRGCNNTRLIEGFSVPALGVEVSAGPVIDGIGSSYAEHIDIAKESSNNGMPVSRETLRAPIVANLREVGAEVIVNFLPVGSEQATYFWAQTALEAGCAFVNAIPVFIATDKRWATKFTDAGLPLIGDDIKSQIGATVLHRELVRLCRLRGVTVDRSYQLNFGGNMDFANMLNSERLTSKRISKTGSVQAELGTGDEARSEGNLHISPSDFVPWLEDRKWAFIRIEGKAFGGAPFMIETKLEVWDSPNAAGVALDAIRCAKVALDRGQSGPLSAPSAFYMKSPPHQMREIVALEDLEEHYDAGRKPRSSVARQVVGV